MHAQVVNFELEYFVIVQLSGSTESTIQRINAAKAEYVTMMINSLSHEILTPLTEILKNCQSYKLKSRTLGGNTNNTPFHKIYPSLSRFFADRDCLDSSRGASVPIQTRTTGWDHTKLLASSSRRFDKKEFTSKIGGFYNSPTTKQGVSIVESCSKLSPRLASVDILPLTSQIMVHSALSNMDETTAVNTLHLKDFPVELIKSAGCPLIGSKRASHQLEKALSNMMEDQKGNIEIRQTCSKVGQMSQHESAAINSIEKVTNRIQIFVDGLMAYSQILSNRFELGLLKPVPMAQFLQELCNIFEEKCLLKQVAITLDCSPHLQINSDRKRLACVFLNFLDNSVKFTNQKGSIRVAVELIEPPQLSPDFLLKSDIKGSELDTQFGRSGADHGVLPGASVKFKISDTGIGINKKDMEIIKYSLSNPFHASPTSSSAGIGIGLRISQALISQLSNSLSQMEIVSLVGEGTTISFELPCDGKHIYQDPNREYPEIKLKFADSLDHHQPSKLPVSEPKENNLEPALRNELNESFGGSISEPNGKLLDQFEDTSRIEFPDQFDDTKYTKQQLTVKPNLPPLFNSNPNSRIVRNSSLIEQVRTGSARYMVRKAESLMKKAPARRNILSLKCENTRFLARRLGDLKQGPQPSQISKNQYASQVAVSLTNLFGQPDTKKVLVVDDEVFLLEFLREILETLGLEVYTASSPERALEISTTLCNLNKKIDLVYMDFNMPGMNGAQCVKLLRSEQHTRAMEHAWFTALSAQDDKYVRDQFKLVGVSEFMSKPYTFDQIVQHLAQRQLISFDNA